MGRALIALGSNLGDRAATLEAAVTAIERLPQTHLLARSSWSESAPVGSAPQGTYLNGVVLVETAIGPLELLDRLQTIETTAGRVRTVHWGPRTLDLDLLLYDDVVRDDQRLTLPHPRMTLRRFVLEPAAQIAAEMVDPTSRMTIGQLWARYGSTPPYVAMMGPPGSGKTRLAGEVAQRSGCLLLLDAGDTTAEDHTRDPANSASPAFDREIEFLARRSRLITIENRPVGQGMISDFWLAQSLAWSEVQGGAELAARVEPAYRQLERQVPPARCVAVVGVGSSPTDRTGDDVPHKDFDERLRTAMRSLVKQAGQPPLVWLATDNWEGAVAELMAALAG
jgi:2-amino-4-hydroxy-6-hydroxymethyldihydropteridine diphosphokinase